MKSFNYKKHTTRVIILEEYISVADVNNYLTAITKTIENRLGTFGG